MIEYYKTIYEGGEGEIVEKKSRFIATVREVKSEDEAVAFIEEMKKKYWDARHNCSAFVIGTNNEIQRCSDDGEPSGTAGKPMLEVLMGEELRNTAVVVTRYFGGTLLGTGGLVRAYQSSTKEGLASSVIIKKCLAKEIKISTDYNGIGKIQYITATMELTTLKTDYTDVVEAYVLVPVSKVMELTKKITEATSARALIEEGREVYYAVVDGEVILFDE